MGRHSAPDDSDVDDAAGTGVRVGGDVADAAPVTGRHSRHDSTRPRPPSPGNGIGNAATAAEADAPPIEGLGLIDDVLAEHSSGPMVIVDAETAEAVVLEPIDEPLAADLVPTTTIPIVELPHDDHPHPHPAPETEAPQTSPTTPPPTAALPTAALPTAALPTAALPTAALPTAAPPAPAAKAAHATRHDLALVMRHGDVRARVVAAALVPFVVFVVVLVVIGELTVHRLIWLPAPAVAAGVLVGLVLDAGHRRYPTSAEPQHAPAAESAR